MTGMVSSGVLLVWRKYDSDVILCDWTDVIYGHSVFSECLFAAVSLLNPFRQFAAASPLRTSPQQIMIPSISMFRSLVRPLLDDGKKVSVR